MASFLVSEGHVEAGDYPVWFLVQEVSVARQRLNQTLRTNAVVAQSAMSAAQHKKGFGPFKKLLERLAK